MRASAKGPTKVDVFHPVTCSPATEESSGEPQAAKTQLSRKCGCWEARKCGRWEARKRGRWEAAPCAASS